ncbi:MAG TPA: HIT domain-containing protein [candidate division WWE3 bacterium]|uniref:HIT domain-containing protein n=1 Tax=candidate division WWE3 bacterium TaxID=2053526 RepID=A0A7C1NMH6_UNCKA|nr:HIT domain-containing protein [candidate division WWE3 bacterium]
MKKGERVLGKEKDCLFCDIAAKRKQEKVVYEDDQFMAFHDIKPSAEIHLLIIPKEHVGIFGVSNSREKLSSEIFALARKIAKDMGVEDSYKLLINAGHSATKNPDHLHVHLIGGWKSPTKVRHV